MRKIIFYLIVINFIACEDVIDVNLPQSEPRLIIDASINWFKGTSGNIQTVKLSLTAPYFDSIVPPANDAIVRITNSQNDEFVFLENENTGVYINNNFTPIINETYQLTVIYNNETYTAIETLKPINPILRVEQSKTGGFLGEDYEIKAYSQDPIDEENYYLIEFSNDIPTLLPSLQVFKDEFVNGNEVFAYYSHEDLEIGNQITIRNYGISKNFYEYMFILLQQTNEGGGPFETQPATVRGNCINLTTKENYPLGYFRLSEVDEFNYTIE